MIEKLQKENEELKKKLENATRILGPKALDDDIKSKLDIAIKALENIAESGRYTGVGSEARKALKQVRGIE